MDANMNKLICSLKSNLPNEIDFALKVSTLLVNSDNFVWSTHYPLVDAICSSVQVLTCVCKDTSITSTCDCYPRFWHKLLLGQQFDNPYLQAATLSPDTERSYNRFAALNDHKLEDHTKIYRRVKAIADLIKEFSMTADTECDEPISTTRKLPKASISLLKFVSLLLFCHDKQFNLIGLDILSNIASKLSKVEESPELVRMFQELCIESICVPDGDVYIMTRSIEAISKIISSSSPSVYSRVVSLIVENDVLARLEQLLTSRSDVTLFFATTECFYRISRHQPHLIAARSSQHLLKTLVNLLNFEDRKFFTSSALSRVELIGPNDIDEMYNSEDFTKPPMVSSSTSTTTTPISKTNSTSAPRQASVPAIKPNSTPLSKPTSVSKHNSIPVNSNSVPVLNNQVPRITPTLSNGVAPQQHPQPVLSVQQHHHHIVQQQAQAPKTVQTNHVSHQPAPHVATKEYVCEWNNCKLRFPTTNGVYTHVFEIHIESLAQDQLTSCQWTGPSGTGPGCLTKRPKYSLLTHLNDFHCNSSALEMALRKSDHVKPPEHPGYGPNAALMAIKRHANLERNGSKLPDNSPISVSVRMTAALILRNLAGESNEMKQALGHYEPILSEICMTNGRDESKIVAECLSLISSR